MLEVNYSFSPGHVLPSVLDLVPELGGNDGNLDGIVLVHVLEDCDPMLLPVGGLVGLVKHISHEQVFF